MAAGLSAYANQVNKFTQTRELLHSIAPAPVLLPCFTIFRRPCKFGVKLVALVYPRGALQFVGFFDDLDAMLNCLAIDNSFAGVRAEIRRNIFPADNVVNNVPRGKLLHSFTLPDFVQLEKVKRPGRQLNYVW